MEEVSYFPNLTGFTSLSTSQPIEFDAIALFDLTPENFAWRAPIPRQIEQRRAEMADVLIFDIILSAGGIQHPDSLYPPRDEHMLRNLLDAIEETTYDSLKKDCLIYFLLKWHKDRREERFQEDRCIPPQFVTLADAYWFLDSGEDVPVSPPFTQLKKSIHPSIPAACYITTI